MNASAPDPFCVHSRSTEPHPRPSRVISATRGRAHTPLKSGLPLASLGISGAGEADWALFCEVDLSQPRDPEAPLLGLLRVGT